LHRGSRALHIIEVLKVTIVLVRNPGAFLAAGLYGVTSGLSGVFGNGIWTGHEIVPPSCGQYTVRFKPWR
jgi:hypothetical protein